MLNRLAAMLAGLVVSLTATVAAAEEGMWTFDAIPVRQVRETTGVRLDAAWLDHLRGASVRLTTGCSGAVVSREGLVVTNAHCVLACAQALSDAGGDLVQDGFLTGKREDERPCPTLQAEILVGIVDATDFIYAASAGKFSDAFAAARQGAIAQAERQVCDGDARLRCQMVSFFGGGQFKVYKYRKYDDVRLVFAPEYEAAFFGGDADNFSFPRFDFDCAFLRLYERGRPAATANRLVWSLRSPNAGEPTFIAGNPGFTERDATAADLEGERDIDLPAVVAQQTKLLSRLRTFAGAAPGGASLAADRLFEEENLIKVYKGRLAALLDPAFMAQRRAAEAAIRARVLGDSRLFAAIGDPWADIAAAQARRASDFRAYQTLESGAGGGSQLFSWARMLVRVALERDRPQGGRLAEYAPSRRVLMRKTLLDPAPVSPGLEILYLSEWLANAKVGAPPGSPILTTIFAGDSPQTRAAGLVRGSRLTDPAVRRALWDGGLPAIQASSDPMVRLALAIDPAARDARTAWEDDVEGPVQRAEERIARARFALEGEAKYPDATFSLRFSWGAVAGWGPPAHTIGPFTTFGGLLGRADQASPLAPRWKAAALLLDPATVFNFTTTNDIAGGNSGSPVVNARGDLLGVAFDGNAASIAGEFVYDPARNRAVALSTVAMSEALGKVYRRTELLRELEGR